MTFQEVVHSAQTAANSREDGVSTAWSKGSHLPLLGCPSHTPNHPRTPAQYTPPRRSDHVHENSSRRKTSRMFACSVAVELRIRSHEAQRVRVRLLREVTTRPMSSLPLLPAHFNHHTLTPSTTPLLTLAWRNSCSGLMIGEAELPQAVALLGTPRQSSAPGTSVAFGAKPPWTEGESRLSQSKMTRSGTPCCIAQAIGHPINDGSVRWLEISA
jgi:hypothetical protein